VRPPRSLDERVADVQRLQRVARSIADRAQSHAFAQVLAVSSGLSLEGVRLALAHHLELDSPAEDLVRLVQAAGDCERVTVVLSANVFVGAFRAIALARAASRHVIVRPSSRDFAFAHAFVDAAIAAGDLGLSRVDTIDFKCIMHGEVHVYGRDETIRAIRAEVDRGVVVRGHGTGLGVAVISEAADPTRAAKALTDDVVAFDQRGCLSPRIVVCIGDEARAFSFAQALDAELRAAEVRVPRGTVPTEEQALATHYLATMAFAGRVWAGPTHGIGVAPRAMAPLLPPPYRHLHLATCSSDAEAEAALAPFRPVITCVGSDARALAARVAPPWARQANLGKMQRPPLDGPVDRRAPHADAER